MRWNIDDVPIFVAVVDQKGLTAAADYLGISKSAVSKSLSRLEDALGVRLLERNSRNVRITSEGEAFYRQGLLIVEQAEEANALMSGLTSTPSGRLVVSMPMAFTREIVAPKLPQFIQLYPDIDLEILVTSQPVDIIRDQIDLAVVIGALGDSELIVKVLYKSQLVCVSSPDYAKANSLGRSIKELRSHIRICESRYADSRFPIRVKGVKTYLDLKKNIVHVNDPIAVREAVTHGCGVALIPNQYCKKQLESGELIQVYKHLDIDVSTSVISAIYPSRRLISNKTRAFLDFLIEICAKI